MKRGFLKNKDLSSSRSANLSPATPHSHSLEHSSTPSAHELQPRDSSAPSGLRPRILNGADSHPGYEAALAELKQTGSLQGLAVGTPIYSTNRFENSVVVMGLGEKGKEIVIVTWGPNRERLRKHPLFKGPLPLLNPIAIHTAMSLIQIRDTKDRGQALYTTRDVAKGEVVVAEHPLILQMQGIPIDIVADYDNQVVSTLRPETRAKLLSLHNCKQSGPTMNEYLSRIRTNAFGINFPFDDALEHHLLHGAVYDVLSRANHSCEPNVGQNFVYEFFIGSLCARRDIKAGEEITVDYVEVSWPFPKRQAYLKEKYSFDCRCAKCVREGPPSS